MSETAPTTLCFRGLTISYDDRVLEPRPWTQAQSAWAAELLAHAAPGAVLELCAGAGQIGLGAVHGTDRRLVMVDSSPAAVDVAAANAAANGMGEQVDVRLARIEEALAEGERFPLVIADPPWVRSTETGGFPRDPVAAIDGGADGLDLARTCVEVIDRHLTAGGAALLQLGDADQAERIAEHVRALPGGLSLTETRQYDGGVVVRLQR
ncbi:MULTISPECIES: methyltransferase [Micrococcus]|uniref:methyltransferase n=1 Tax=Micrococcus TaxID=1269 RepID=UPI000BF09683|nr:MULTISPECIES: methyltransferase [Micrococcus]MBE1538254.1 methylase of polypeptide subunit release factors [Micrococcus yunnanensis]MCF8559681.1 methyltransferase [Micrococcus yunnanensis]MCV7537326.1 methyltransferase [Micrococcus luteus]MCV7670852.1 methyltransferase [Micrococcus luteus]PEH50742.1 methyltransferase [Micrococcus luteus]